MRKDKGISQDKLALAADIDRSYVGRIERGEVNITLEKSLPDSKCPSVRYSSASTINRLEEFIYSS